MQGAHCYRTLDFNAETAEKSKKLGYALPFWQSMNKIRRQLRFSDPEWDALQAAADKAGVTRTEYIRNAALEAAGYEGD